MKFGDFSDVAFEPRIFRASPVYTPSTHERMGIPSLAWSLLFLAALSAWLGVVYLITRRISFDVAAAAICAMFATAGVGWLFPTYFRITPGQLEVITINHIWPRQFEIERFDLRTSRVVADLPARWLFLDNGSVVTKISLMFMRERVGMAYWLFLAAISTHDAPALPADRLLG